MVPIVIEKHLKAQSGIDPTTFGSLVHCPMPLATEPLIGAGSLTIAIITRS